MTRPTPEQEPPPPLPIQEPLTQAVIAADLANALVPVELPVLDAVEAANVVSLVQTEDLATEVMFQAAERAAVRTLEGFTDWYQVTKAAELAKTLSELVRLFKESVARLADGYTAEILSHISGTKIKPMGTRKTDMDRYGIDPVEVYKRVAAAARWQQSKIDRAMMDVVAGADPDTLNRLVSPEQAALHRAHQLIRSDLSLAKRAQIHRGMINAAERDLTSEFYRRVIHPELSDDGEGTCGLCIAASTRKYHVKDLMALHPGCHCGEVAIGKDGYDPGGAINDADLSRLYGDAGSTSAEDLRNTRYKVDEHGELGPVLRPAGEPTRSAEDVDRIERGQRAIDARKARQREGLNDRLIQKRDELQASYSKLYRNMTDDPENWPDEEYTPILRDLDHRIETLNGVLGERRGEEDSSLFKVVDTQPFDLEHTFDHIDGSHRIEDDVHATNPNFFLGGEWAMNCVHVVQAEELRRRGFDVDATPLPREFWAGQGRNVDEALHEWSPQRDFIPTNVAGAKSVAQNWPDGARGWVTLSWQRGGSHVFNVEKVGDRVVWSDAQKGVPDFDPDTYFDRALPTVRIVRVDDLTPTREVAQFVKPSGSLTPRVITAQVDRRKDIQMSQSLFGTAPPDTALRLRAYDDLSPSLQKKITDKLESQTALTEPELANRVQANMDRLYRSGDPAQLAFYKDRGDDLAQRADAINAEFGTHLTQEQMIGMVSVTSAHKNWTENTKFADDMARKLAADEPFEVTNMMLTDYNTWVGKRRGGLATPVDIKPGIYRPSELPSAFVASKTPGIPKAMNTDFGIKAVQIFRGESTVDEIVHGPKQRSFVNNLIDPKDPRFVTVDTWHYRAMMQGVPFTREIGPKDDRHTYTYTLEEWADRDLSVADGRAALFGYDATKDRYDDDNIDATIKAADNMSPQLFFQSGPASKADDWEGTWGTYPWFVKQTQIAAERAGVSPAEFQAVVWYAIGGGRA